MSVLTGGGVTKLSLSCLQAVKLNLQPLLVKVADSNVQMCRHDTTMWAHRGHAGYAHFSTHKHADMHSRRGSPHHATQAGGCRPIQYSQQPLAWHGRHKAAAPVCFSSEGSTGMVCNAQTSCRATEGICEHPRPCGWHRLSSRSTVCRLLLAKHAARNMCMQQASFPHAFKTA